MHNSLTFYHSDIKIEPGGGCAGEFYGARTAAYRPPAIVGIQWQSLALHRAIGIHP